jgi:biopolymer transport protein ExbB/TolQ
MRTVLSWYQNGGPFVVPLIIVGVVGVVLLIERLAYLVVRSRIYARPFIERVLSLVRAGKLDDALRLCADHHAALPDVGLVILRSRSRDEEALLDVAEASMLTVLPALTRRTAWLETLARVAIMLGVLGGIVSLNDALSLPASPAADPSLVSALAIALRPVALGVLTAIPLLVGHAYLVYEAQRITEQLEEFSTRLVNALIDRPDVRLGHR